MDNAYLGVIEGYYGKSYTDDERQFLLSFMKEQDYRFYIYAPKEDEQLRDKWDRPISEDYVNHLSHMHDLCQQRSLDFGIALSPLNLTKRFDEQSELILQRVKELTSASKCEIFCLLFDDMHKDSEHFGAVQNKIIQSVERVLPEHVKHFIICPSYYTEDPCIERTFGKRPEHYFEELVKDLPERVEIFWTGPMVLSEDLTVEHLEKITKLLGRKPFIWDNYPVNDGQSIYHYLFLKKFNGRRNIAPYITGHAVNPMVQCALSTLAEVTLPLIYKGKSDEEIDAAWLKQAHELFGKATDDLVKPEVIELFCKTGLNKMTEEQKAHLKQVALKDKTRALEELLDFLNGSYRFDQTIINGTNPVTIALVE